MPHQLHAAPSTSLLLPYQVELVPGESREQVGLADARVAYQDHLEEELEKYALARAHGPISSVM